MSAVKRTQTNKENYPSENFGYPHTSPQKVDKGISLPWWQTLTRRSSPVKMGKSIFDHGNTTPLSDKITVWGPTKPVLVKPHKLSVSLFAVAVRLNTHKDRPSVTRCQPPMAESFRMLQAPEHRPVRSRPARRHRTR